MARILRFPARLSQQETDPQRPSWISPERWGGFLEGTKKLAELLRTH